MADEETFPAIQVSIGLSVLVLVGLVAGFLYIRYRQKKLQQSDSMKTKSSNDIPNEYKHSYNQETIHFDTPRIPFEANRNMYNPRQGPSRALSLETGPPVDNIYATNINVDPFSGPSRGYSSAWSRLQYSRFDWHDSLDGDNEVQRP